VSANLDLVRSIFADWERGDYGRADWADPSIEIELVGGPQPGRWTGFAGMVEVARSIFDAWEGFHHGSGAQFRELDDARVLCFYSLLGRGKTSGMDLAQMQSQGTAVFRIRDGKVVSLIINWDRDRALADLGLEE
jgi:hypothetical protein